MLWLLKSEKLTWLFVVRERNVQRDRVHFTRVKERHSSNTA